MDMKQMTAKSGRILWKYRYALLVLALGFLLMTLPMGSRKTQQDEPIVEEPTIKQDASAQLAQILGQIHGVGKVQVLLTIKTGQTTVYQTNEDTDLSETGSSIRKETVIITDSNRNQQALSVQVLPPDFLGAVVVCQGADDPVVRLAVVEAVSKATGLKADKISVLKMK
jgi:stage III sporulation protein AG